MADQVTFPSSIGGSGKTYTSDANPDTGVFNGGHRINFFPMLADTVAAAGYVAQYAQAIDGAKANADRAEDAKGYVEAVADQYQVNILEQFKQKATLVSDFANQEFKLYDGLRKNDIADTSLWTIERATTGTYVDATGKIRTAAIDEPRYDYSLGLRGGLITQESRTNLVLHSSDFSQAVWYKSRVTVTSNAATAPDGSTTADKIIPTTEDDVHFVSQSGIGIDASEAYCRSTFVKSAGIEQVSFRPASGAWEDAGWVGYLNLLTGEVIGNQSDDVDVVELNDGWYRISTQQKADEQGLTGGLLIAAAVNNSISFAGDGSSGIYMWGAQLEKGAGVSSLVNTGASTVTRASDLVYRSTAAELNESEGTLYWSGFLKNFVPQLNAIINLGAGAADRRFCVESVANNNLRVRVISPFPGVSYAGTASSAIPFNMLTKVALTYSRGDGNLSFKLVVNGVLVDDSTVTIGDLNFRFLTLGTINLSQTYGSWLDHSDVVYTPNTTTTAELETLTAI